MAWFKKTGMESTVKELAKLFKKMVKNHYTFGAIWKNIALGQKAFEIMKALPDTVEGEFDTPEEKAALLGKMLGQMEETLSPRFCIEVREYMQALDAGDESNRKALEQLRDFIDLDLPMEEYCKKYGRHLKFDPVERTREWEDIICKVEEECEKKLKDERRGMGFCFMYWMVKGNVLGKYGIQWDSPAVMNPRVRFD